jgi:hypothetical protein
MTSIAFIAGVLPLVFSFGAGAEMRMPSALELELCRFQGEHVARIASDLAAGRAGQRP